MRGIAGMRRSSEHNQRYGFGFRDRNQEEKQSVKKFRDWAPWSRELARKIAEGGERYLIDRAKLVAWRDAD